MKTKNFLVFSAVLSVGGYGAYWYLKNRKKAIPVLANPVNTTQQQTSTTQSGTVTKTDGVLNTSVVPNEFNRTANIEEEKRKETLALEILQLIKDGQKEAIQPTSWSCKGIMCTASRPLRVMQFNNKLEEYKLRLKQLGYEYLDGKIYKM